MRRCSENEFLKLANLFPVVAILGARQVGKTTLAKQLMQKLKQKTIYLDLENPTDIAKLRNPTAFFELHKNNCVIIDEIQRRSDLFPILRWAIDSHRIPCRFIVLGSASPTLLASSSETLAGRILYKELTPFTLDEVGEHNLHTHWLVGGFPEPFLSKDDFFRGKWYTSFIQTYIEREFAIIGLKTSVAKLSRFFTMLAHIHGHLLNKSTLAKSLDVSIGTIERYLSYMENAFLVRVLRPFFINLKKRLVKSPKVYIRDSGILHAMLDLRRMENLLSHPILGNSWEGYVIEQILSAFPQYSSFFYRTQSGAECDLVLVKNTICEFAIEVKFSDSPRKSKSLTTALQDLKTKHNLLVVPFCDEPYPLDSKIVVCDLPTAIDLVRKAQKSH